MDAEQYLHERLENQIDWYDRKSALNKNWSTGTKVIEIICAALIPFLAGQDNNGSIYYSISIGLLGVVVAGSAGISALLKFQEQWIKYRTTAESLKKEKYLFMTRVEPYDVENPLPIFVQRVETLVSQENTNWAQYMMKPSNEGKNGQDRIH